MNRSLVPVGNTTLVRSDRIHIAELDHLDQREDMALPYLRVVQPTSIQAELMVGGDAKPEQFYGTALRVADNDLAFAILAIQKLSVVWQEGKEPQLTYPLPSGIQISGQPDLIYPDQRLLLDFKATRFLPKELFASYLAAACLQVPRHGDLRRLEPGGGLLRREFLRARERAAYILQR